MENGTIPEETDYEIARVLSEEYNDSTYASTSENWLSRLYSGQSLLDVWELVSEYVQPIKSIFPRVNDTNKVDDEELQTNRADLEEKLRVYGMQEKSMKGDGNCQFSSLSDQLYNSPSYHLDVREMVVEQLRENPDIYASYVPGIYEDYVQKMEGEGEWGDHVTLQAAADVLGVRIYVLTSFRNESFIEVQPREQKSERCLYLSFWAEVQSSKNYIQKTIE
eukprot:g768.t1